MKLTKWPKTELEYWFVIDFLGSFLWRINHDLAGDCIQSASEKKNELKEVQQTMDKLVLELAQFGVVHPKECPTIRLGEEKPKAFKGKMWYWEWYKKMKKIYYSSEYENLICSACPFSNGLEELISGNGILCSLIDAMLYQLPEPALCAVINRGGDCSREMLLEEIRKKGGDEAVEKFKAKENELKVK